MAICSSRQNTPFPIYFGRKCETGAVVDSSNGASNKLTPNPLTVRLVANGQTGQEVLIDKKGKDAGTVEAHNNKVRVDVAKSIGPDAAGLPAPMPSPTPTGP